MLEELIEQILAKLDKLEKDQNEFREESRLRLDSINKRLSNIELKVDSIENKIGSIASTYETHELLLGRAITDIELLKKLILNQ